MIYLQLLYTFGFLGIFSFGGGYAMVSLVQKEVVLHHAWMTAEQFTNMLAIAQTAPGPLAVNMATYVGFNAAGILGSVVAILGLLLPALIIIIGLAILMQKNQDNPLLDRILLGMKPMVVALIIGAAITLGRSNLLDWQAVLLGVLALALTLFTKIHPVLLILAFGIFGIIIN